MRSNLGKQSSETWMSRNAAALEGNVSNYYRWNLAVFPIEKKKRILDLGCGPGIYFDEIIRYEPSLYVGVDYSENYVEQIRTKFDRHPNCEALCLSITDREQMMTLRRYRFDYVLCFDVIEHLEDDEAALRNIIDVMRASGPARLFLRVPALESLYGANDSAIGHYRRYSIRALRELLARCSLRVDRIRYQNALGILPWYIKGSVLKEQQAVTSGEARLFNTLVPLVSFVERLVSPPVGLSLYAVCSVP